MYSIDYLEKRLRFISRRLTHFDLQKPDPEDQEISLVDIEEFLSESERKNHLFLNFYTRAGLCEALEQYGTFDRLRSRGFDPYLSFHPIDSERYILHLTDSEHGAVLIEMVCKLATIKSKNSKAEVNSGETFDLLAVEWLLLQNPSAKFTEERPPLPGQKHPGLGIGREVITLLQIMTERLEKDGMLAIPAYYHNGVLYNNLFHFFSPEKEAELRAIERDLANLTLAEASWAIENKLVMDRATGNKFEWHPEEMIWARTEKLNNYFSSDYYSSLFNKILEEKSFYLCPPLPV
ncbi:MAG: hypothetical protein HY819_19605 [Acidobacteria bacterium]|nr:hypothetical protein [Acidobacteriota bacterium]